MRSPETDLPESDKVLGINFFQRALQLHIEYAATVHSLFIAEFGFLCCQISFCFAMRGSDKKITSLAWRYYLN